MLLERRNTLAERAEVCAALPDDGLLDRGAAAQAGLALLVVDVEVLLVRPRLAVAIAIVAQGAAAVLDSLEQRDPDAGVQPGDLVVVKTIAGAQRVELSEPQRLIGVDIADPCDHALVEQQRLELRAAAAQQCGERLGGE